jgi:hypothetical protein
MVADTVCRRLYTRRIGGGGSTARISITGHNQACIQVEYTRTTLILYIGEHPGYPAGEVVPRVADRIGVVLDVPGRRLDTGILGRVVRVGVGILAKGICAADRWPFAVV